MRFSLLFFLFAFHYAHTQNNTEASDVLVQSSRYTLDKLPVQWLHKPKVLKAIDDILPVAIAQLKDSRSCMNCMANYTLSLKIDTVYIQSQVDHTTGFGEQGGQPYTSSQNETMTTFTYSSKLCIWDSIGHEVARLIITEPEGERYRVYQGNLGKGGRVVVAPIVFVGSGRVVLPGQNLKAGIISKEPPLGVVPTEDELMGFTADKLVTMSKWIRNRKLQD